MATVPSNPHTRTAGVLKKESGRKNELLHDRIVAVLVVVGLITLFGLIIWLASLGGPAPSGDYYDDDLWMGP